MPRFRVAWAKRAGSAPEGEFSVEAMVARYVALYREALARD